jgi:hypothetical protein
MAIVDLKTARSVLDSKFAIAIRSMDLAASQLPAVVRMVSSLLCKGTRYKMLSRNQAKGLNCFTPFGAQRGLGNLRKLISSKQTS